MDITTVKNISFRDSTSSNFSDSKSEDLLPFSLVLVYTICVRYIACMIWLVAVPANLLIIGILIKQKHRSHSTSVYFLSLALADLFVNFRTFNFWLVKSGLIVYTSDFECQMDKGYPLLGMLASSWTLATISVERMISVRMPYKMKQVCTVIIARITVIVIWMTSLGVAFLNGWFHHMESSTCVIKKEHRDFFIKHIIYLDYTLDVVVPFLVILVNSAITLIRVSSRQSCSSTSSKAFGKSITVLVLFINVLFFVTQTPYGIMFILQQIHPNTLRLDYLEAITLVLKYVNYCVNFYVYFLTASKFRQETKHVYISCKQQCLRLCSQSVYQE